MRSDGLAAFHRLAVVAIALFLLAPAVVITVLSFSNEDHLVFPPSEWGFRQYSTLIDSAYWRSAVAKSFLIALPVATISLAIGVPLAYALARSRMYGRTALRTLSIAPLIIPGSAYAVAMYVFYLQVGLLGQDLGLIFAHVAIGIPFVVIVTTAALVRIPIEFEMVAMTLGASRWRAVIGITGRLLVPALATAFIFVFIASFDEATFVNFVGGPGLVTVPKAIFDSLKVGIDPVITAIATILMVMTGVIMTLGLYLRPERRTDASIAVSADE